MAQDTATTKAAAEAAAIAEAQKNGGKVDEIILVGEPTTTSAAPPSLTTDVRLTMKGEIAERRFRYTCAMDGTGGFVRGVND
jgi:hypothetical protein